MSVEQWVVLAFVVLLPLIEGLARFRRAHAGNGESSDRIGEMGTSHRGLVRQSRDADHAVAGAAKEVVSPSLSRPPSLPQSASAPAVSLSGHPVAGNGVVRWLRPVRNLRRAIVVATILGPPTR